MAAVLPKGGPTMPLGAKEQIYPNLSHVLRFLMLLKEVEMYKEYIVKFSVKYDKAPFEPLIFEIAAHIFV